MKISPPLCITSRLMAGYRFEDGTSISIEYDDVPGDEGRTRYHYYIDLPDGREYERSDLQSGFGRHELQEGLTSLVYFLLGAAECTISPAIPEGHSFEEHWVAEWAAENYDELEMLALDLETEKRIQE